MDEFNQRYFIVNKCPIAVVGENKLIEEVNYDL